MPNIQNEHQSIRGEKLGIIICPIRTIRDHEAPLLETLYGLERGKRSRSKTLRSLSLEFGSVWDDLHLVPLT